MVALNVQMTRFLIIIFFSYACHLLLYVFVPFMVLATPYGGSRSLYGGVYMIRGCGEEVYYPTWVAA
jgi:hypothetical protein